jgi:hypothetical protein
MKKIILLILISFTANSQDLNFKRSWGTYFGDDRYQYLESAVDTNGDLYVVGLITNDETIPLPVFESTAHQPTYGGGSTDGFIAKFNNQGEVLWISYFGGTNQDMISGIAIDGSNSVYIVGTTDSETDIATTGSLQPIISGGSDVFVARFSPNGILEWSTYYGGTLNDGTIFYSYSGRKNLQIAHDSTNSLYILAMTDSSGLGTTDTFQTNKENSPYILTKFDNYGQRVWATYYGNYTQNQIYSLTANTEAVYLVGNTFEIPPTGIPYNTYFGTAGTYNAQPNNYADVFVSKFDTEGHREWSTYYGGTTGENTSSNCVKTFQNKLYFTGEGSSNILATSGTFQETTNAVSPFLVEFNPDGTRRNWATFNGLAENQTIVYGSHSLNITIDSNGKLYQSGTIGLTANIATTSGFQTNLIYSNFTNNLDGFVSVFDNSGQKLWGTYYGGNNRELEMISHPYENNFYIVGTTASTESIATPNSLQPNFILTNTDPNASLRTNIFIAHFEPNNLSISKNTLNSLQLFPNPNKGNFSIKGNFSSLQNLEMIIYDNQGRTIYTKKIIGLEDTIPVTLENKLQSGMYFVKIFNSEIEKTIKMMVE